MIIDWSVVSNYPGAELVLPGLSDAAAGRVTIASCLVSVARPLIEESGLTKHLPSIAYVAEPEHALYRLLREEGGNAYGRYNSLLRRLVSFEQAVRRARSHTGA